MYVYMNGQFMKEDKVRISPFDHGFLYGLGLFETFRVYDGHPFLLDDHLTRLNHGLETLHIETRFGREDVVQIIRGLIEKNECPNAYIRLNVSAGNGMIGLQTESYLEPNVLMFSKPLPSPGALQEKKAVLLELRRNSPEGLYRLKSHHYLNNVLAKREIGPSANVEGIFLTNEGYLAEGIVSNLFWYKDGKLFTPSVKTGILNGVTRQFVIELAKKQGIEVTEGLFLPDDAMEADELFLTNSIQEIVAVSEFSGRKFPGSQGSFVKKLDGLYGFGRKIWWSRNEIAGGRVYE